MANQRCSVVLRGKTYRVLYLLSFEVHVMDATGLSARMGE